MRRKTLFGIIGAILLAAVFFVCAVGSSWFTNGDIKTWFNGWGYGKPEENNEQSNVIMTEGGSNGVALMCAAIPSAEFAAYSLNEEETESAFTLTLEVTPENSVVTNFTWTAEFVNPASEWASGKDINDYYTVTPAEDNRSAVAACKQAFGEQIRIKAVYDGDTTIFATKLADYVKKPMGYSYAYLDTLISLLDESASFDFATEVDGNIIYGIGTVKGSVLFENDAISGYVELSDDAYNWLLASDNSAYQYMSQFLAANNNDIGFTKKSYVQYHHWAGSDDPYVEWFDDLRPSAFLSKKVTELKEVRYFYAAFRELALNASNQFRLVLNFTYKYGDSYSQAVSVNTDFVSLNPELLPLIDSINIGGGNLLH